MAASFPTSNDPASHAYYDSYDHLHELPNHDVHATHSNELENGTEEHAGHHEHDNITEDPHLRQNLERMINAGYNGGSFGSFGLLSTHENHSLAQLPHGSIAFAQASGSDSAPPPVQKEKAARSKVSRACDECQRLQQLEQQVHDPQASSTQQQSELRKTQADTRQAAYSANGAAEPRTGDKRIFSATEDFSPHSSWDGASTVSQPQQTQTQLSPPNMRTQQPFWRLTSSSIPDFATIPYDQSSLEAANTPIASFDWDEDVVGEYYRLIHQTFPLLPNSKTRLKHRLVEIPGPLRDAFLGALDCLTRTFPTSSLQPTPSYHQTLKRAAESLAKYPFDNPSSHTPATNLCYLQTLLLMAIETDNHGPATIRGQAGPSRAEWLGRAAGVAGQLEINIARSDVGNNSLITGDRDSEDRLARRVWWVLFILDRWHASSTADLLKLPENSVLLLPEDQILLGESTYHLARLSFIIGHLAAILTTTKTPSTDVMAPSNPASSLLTLTLAGEIDRFRESVEGVWGSLNLVHLSYHHVHLLIKRLNPLTEPDELIGHAVKVAAVLNSRQTPLTPLNHHFAALSAMTLCELCDVRKTRAQAIKGLVDLRTCLGGGLGLAGFEGSEGWDGAVRELVVDKLDRIDSEGERPSTLHGDDDGPLSRL
ncbi:hypothetical protein AMS68_006941 [Peltaster fructicola]|uniref:Xylanolytic transcriptional activator regulatory domain-containing protein n=1 Tax=Peltaster fructicola TaxID=286661 RepID=A0A6H0Y347_9PEZI|nr:hypothetical protein AMS68_006941 [Peltaster fructicola]